MHRLRARPQLLALFAALALAVRLLVPAGSMPQVAHGRVAIVACPGVVAMQAHGHGLTHDAPDHDGFEQPCPFAAVTIAAAIVAIAVLFAMAIAPSASHVPRPSATCRTRASVRWRPPLRAPPTILPVR